MKTLILTIAVIFSVSTLTVPQPANAWVWFVAKKIIKSDSKSLKDKKDISWWDSKTKNDHGWEADRNDPDWKQLNYREKDWYK